MRVKLKGINRVSKHLADGSGATYYYAWKGDPRLPGKPGDAKFISAFNAAVAKKAGLRVNIPVGGELKTALDPAAKAKTAVTILTTTNGTPRTSDGFRTSWGKIVAKAKVTGLTFHDLRGTAVTRFALGGCSEAEIATFTGHSLKDVGAILDAHNLSRYSRMAETALKKREAHEAGTKIPN